MVAVCMYDADACLHTKDVKGPYAVWTAGRERPCYAFVDCYLTAKGEAGRLTNKSSAKQNKNKNTARHGTPNSQG